MSTESARKAAERLDQLEDAIREIHNICRLAGANPPSKGGNNGLFVDVAKVVSRFPELSVSKENWQRIAAAGQTVAPPPGLVELLQAIEDMKGYITAPHHIPWHNILHWAEIVKSGAAPAVSTPPHRCINCGAPITPSMDGLTMVDASGSPTCKNGFLHREPNPAAVSTPRCPKCECDAFQASAGMARCSNFMCRYEGRTLEFFQPAPSPPQPRENALTPHSHKPWCASMPRPMDLVMGRGPYRCDCGAVASPQGESK